MAIKNNYYSMPSAGRRADSEADMYGEWQASGKAAPGGCDRLSSCRSTQIPRNVHPNVLSQHATQAPMLGVDQSRCPGPPLTRRHVDGNMVRVSPLRLR